MARLTTQYVEDDYRRTLETVSDYEQARWLANRRNREDFRMMAAFIDEAIGGAVDATEPLSVIEVGPGAGTWTKRLRAQRPRASFTLVDISDPMLAQARANLGEPADIGYVHGDFAQVELPTCDLLFSARALEYFPDKRVFVARAREVLRPGGRGIVITKSPSFWPRVRARRRGRDEPLLHSEQIAPADLAVLLREAGFEAVRCDPVVLRLPYRLPLQVASRVVWRWLRRGGMRAAEGRFCEAYAATFTAPAVPVARR